QVRGHRLRTPGGRKTRPTSDRVREALFNILGARVVESLFLDLFAGSGAVGLEALSRGARQAVFVENDRQALACLHDNLAATGFKDKGVVIGSDVRRGVAGLLEEGRVFDLIFLDPPYRQGWGEVILPAAVPLLAPEGVVILETAVSEAAPEIAGMEIKDRRVYGDTALIFYGRAGGLADGVHDPDRGNGKND
ncbi:MAG: 16S rRNA (guanine(966)-N(2))-methyltransferase RsmD, partial [Moorella sp. (in: Bacteria)]|nr:16S rRNA (guanine(966)-N(2))-methyltransferase RsmD [Moorella sp. (in: firmicutes)]